MAVVVLGVDRGQQRVAGADPRRHEPQHRDRQPAQQHQQPQPGFADEQPHAVDRDERPGLGPDQRRADAQQEGGAALAGQVPVDRPQRQTDEHRLRRAAVHVVGPLLGEHHPDRGQRARQRSHPRLSRGHPRRQTVGRHQRHEPAGAGRDHPQRRRGAAEQPVDGGEDHRERLPRGPTAGGEAQVRVDQLAPPHDPRPRVVAGDGREDRRRQRGQRQADDAPDHQRRAEQVPPPRVPRARIPGRLRGRVRRRGLGDRAAFQSGASGGREPAAHERRDHAKPVDRSQLLALLVGAGAVVHGHLEDALAVLDQPGGDLGLDREPRRLQR